MKSKTAIRIWPVLIGILLGAGTMTGPIVCGEEPAKVKRIIGGYDRAAGAERQTRSVTFAQHGMAATSDMRASQAAIDVLRDGGSAVDAAITANCVLGVVEPMSCGIGGDLFSIVWDSQKKELAGLNASGRSPQLATLATFEKRGLQHIPMSSALSWSVPGCVSGWHDLHRRYGRLPWKRLFQPAIELAEQGFPVAPVIAGYWKSAEATLLATEPARQTFLIDGQRAPREGEIVRNPQLGKTLRRIADLGAVDFYQGEIADAIDAYSRSLEDDGLLRKSDLQAHRNDWIEPVSTNYRGYDVWELPPSGQGISVLQMLNMIEPYNVREMGWGTPESTHLFIETKKLAYADRARFYADLDMADVPVKQLISKKYAQQRGQLYQPDQALKMVPAGDPKLIHGDTVYLCVVDKDRNCCSLIQSNFQGFGSGLIAGQLGFAMQNRGALFALDANHPNALAPGKRPFHTIIPALVTRDQKPVFVFGVMGGDMQPQGHVQILMNWIDHRMNIQMAGDAARVRHEGSATPTGLPEDPPGGTVYVESGIPEETVTALKAKGHTVVRGGGMGGYQGILIDWEKGVLQGATESRKDGVALGY